VSEVQALRGVASTEVSLWGEFAGIAGASLATHPSLVALALVLLPDRVFHCWREGALVLPGYSWGEEADATRRRLLTYLVAFLGCTQLLRSTIEGAAGLVSRPLQAVSQAGAEALDRLLLKGRGFTPGTLAGLATIAIPGVSVALSSPGAASAAAVSAGTILCAVLAVVYFALPNLSARVVSCGQFWAWVRRSAPNGRAPRNWEALAVAAEETAVRHARWAVVQRLQRKWHRLGVKLQVSPWAREFRGAFPNERARRSWRPAALRWWLNATGPSWDRPSADPRDPRVGGSRAQTLDPFHDWPTGPRLRWWPRYGPGYAPYEPHADAVPLRRPPRVTFARA